MKTKQTPVITTSKPMRPTAAQIVGNLIISVGEARKILGADAKGQSDDELILEIYQLSEAIQEVLNTTISQNKQL